MNDLSKYLVDQILLEEKSPIKNVVVVYVGRFQPMHKGHHQVYEHLVKKFGRNNVFVGTSNKVQRPKSPFNFKEKREIMTTMFGIPSNKIVQVKNPYAPTEVLKKFNEEETAFVTVVGKKDASRLGGKYFDKWDGKPTHGYKEKGYIYISPAFGNISGTETRNGLSVGSEEQRKSFFKDRAYGKYNEKIFRIITDKLNEGIEISKETIEDWLISESSKLAVGHVDDGPVFWLPNLDLFGKINIERATKIGYDVVSKILNKDLEDYYEHPTYPNGPVPTTTWFPAGVIGDRKNTNVLDIYTNKAYTKWYAHVTRQMALTGYQLVQTQLEKDNLLQDKQDSVQNAQNAKELEKEFENSLDENIKIPVKVGDTILTGRFKNKKVVVKNIGKDEHGMPTINGKKVVTFRLMKEQYIVEIAGTSVDCQMCEHSWDIDEKDPHPYLCHNCGYDNQKLEYDYDEWNKWKDSEGIKEQKRVEFYESHFKNLVPSNFSVSKEDNNIKISIPSKITKMSKPTDENINEVSSNGGYTADAGEPDTIFVTNGKIRKLGIDKGRPEYWYENGGYTQLHFPKGDYPFGKGKSKDKESQIRQVVYKVKNVVSSDLTPPEKDDKKEIKKIVEMSRQNLDKIEKYAEKQLSPEDIEFTRHFFDRLNDPRNGKEISDAELVGFFKRLSRFKKKFKEFLEKYEQIVVKDKRSNINIPFLKQANQIIAKTIMRKSNFKTSNPTLAFEQLAKGMSLKDIANKHNVSFDELSKEAKKGVEVEMEHTSDVKVAYDIAKDHLYEDPKYYTKLATIEETGVGTGQSGVRMGYPSKDDLKKRMKDVEDQRKKTDSDKEFQYKPIKESILTEGGAYGHMNHPFDTDINLTFGDLKDIVNRALEGTLEFTREKTDGQALAISWRDDRGLIAARNKSHLKNQGKGALDINGVSSKFQGRGGLTDAYNFAMRDLTKAISSLSSKQRDKIFKQGSCFMNLEVIWPTSVNVIPYGQALLVFHGTMEYDEDGKAIGENTEAARILAGMIKQINQDVQDSYTIKGPPVLQLPKSQDLSKKKAKYTSQISKLQSEFGLKNTDGVADYHQAWWEQWIDKNTPKPLDNKTKMGLVKRWAFMDKSFRLDNKNITDSDLLDWAKKHEKDNHKKIAKDNLMKFEQIFLGLGAEVLEFTSSALTVNPDKAVRDIKKRIDKTIKDVKKSGDPKKIEKLKLELERLNSIGGKDKIVPNEGIVFLYRGLTMKLTGTFAPTNQILGIFF
jgi:cytidyltransferase-like protein